MMKKLPIKKDTSNSILIERIEKEYDWSGKTGVILLKETKDLIKALEGINYTEKQIIQELKKNGNI